MNASASGSGVTGGAVRVDVRRATDDDYAAFTRLFPELQVEDPVPSRELWTAALRPLTWIAERAGAVVGYAYCQELEDSAYLRQIVVEAASRRHGVARALLGHLAQHLVRRGKSAWRLNVKRENEAARRLYTELGFSVAYSTLALRLPWTALDALPPGEASCEEAAAERDASLESVFGLPARQLANARSPGRFVLVAASGGAPVGLAVFDPDHPGAFPFRVLELGAAESLLRAMRARARPSDAFTGVVLEDDERLVELLMRAGATVRHDLVHMTARLPVVV